MIRFLTCMYPSDFMYFYPLSATKSDLIRKTKDGLVFGSIREQVKKVDRLMGNGFIDSLRNIKIYSHKVNLSMDPGLCFV